jgi:hypothetical protein
VKQLVDRLGLSREQHAQLSDAVAQHGLPYLKRMSESRKRQLDAQPKPATAIIHPETPTTEPQAPTRPPREEAVQKAQEKIMGLLEEGKPGPLAKAINEFILAVGAAKIARAGGEEAVAAKTGRLAAEVPPEAVKAFRKGVAEAVATLAPPARKEAVQRLVDNLLAEPKPKEPEATAPPKETPVKPAEPKPEELYRSNLDEAAKVLLDAAEKGANVGSLRNKLVAFRKAAGAMALWADTKDVAKVDTAAQKGQLLAAAPRELFAPLQDMIQSKAIPAGPRLAAALKDGVDQIMNRTSKGSQLRLLEPDAAMAEPEALNIPEPLVPVTRPVEFGPQPEGLPPNIPDRVPSVFGDAWRHPTGEPWWLVDSKNNFYKCHYEIVRADEVFTSHTLDLKERPGYNQDFQNRTNAEGRRDWITDTAANPDVRHFQSGGSQVTVGPPTVWRDGPKDAAETHNVCVAGNGRTLVVLLILSHPESKQAAIYRQYLAKEAAALGIEHDGHPMNMLVRVVDLEPDQITEAITLAQNSQESPSVPLATAAKILSEAVLRKNKMTEPPNFEFDSPPLEITIDNVADVVRNNHELIRVIQLIAGTKTTAQEMFNPNVASELVKSVKSALLTVLSDEALKQMRFVSLHIHNGIQNAMPGLIRLMHYAATRSDWKGIDFSAILTDALKLFDNAQTKGDMSEAKMTAIADEFYRQIHFAGRAIPVSKLSVAFALGLSELSGNELALSRRILRIIYDVESTSQTMLFGGKKGKASVDIITREFIKDVDLVALLPDDHQVARDPIP